MRFTVTIKEKKEVLKEVTITAVDSDQAKEWGTRQAKELGCPDAKIVVMTAQE